VILSLLADELAGMRINAKGEHAWVSRDAAREAVLDAFEAGVIPGEDGVARLERERDRIFGTQPDDDNAEGPATFAAPSVSGGAGP
jgi:hypothetical protein